MEKRLLLVFILILISITPVNASTSFVTYFQEPIYGFNLDWEEPLDIWLELEDVFGNIILGVSAKYGHTVLPMALMTDKGQFATLQLQYPVSQEVHIHHVSDKAPNEIVAAELIVAHMMGLGLDAVLTLLEELRLVHFGEFTFHHLFADQAGNAAIIEVGEEENEIIFSEEQFIVMTNFKNSDFRDVPYYQVTGEGADRYIKANELIQAHRDKFDLDATFEVLEATAQGSTVSSLAFLPKANSVYFTLFGDFDKIWKISLDERTIETYRGFADHKKSPIPQVGIFGSDLMRGVF